MELSYWQSRWKKDNTGWHMETVYPPLPKLWSHLSIDKNSRVLVPLCGKSRDMGWFLEQGHAVTGIETSTKAINELKEKYSGEFTKEQSHGFTIYTTDRLRLWQGDFLKLPSQQIESPAIIYDKAAIVALPPAMRKEYAQKVLELCNPETQILLQTFEYEQGEMNGPPFSVKEKEIRKLFGNSFSLNLLHEQPKFKELKKFQQRGLSSYLTEKIFLLTPP
ncbi:thiopurine S-methyltransferase [Fodinibius halophilus]|uniref:Thiopurine S-methyltransferase n=1 Tax=Fodinibius halophilus TaxID=1736908 RepID=A0A6M1T9G7_9BACT|nr:thiopurine S-methyltransferase [Fodinibius halophilus]NGP88661.1 thiopurine S-methyltransferase [Fodinibius halophilus]